MPFTALLPRAKAVTPAAIDKALRVARSWAYPKQILYLLASFTALISLVHFGSLSYRYLTRRRIFSARNQADAGKVKLTRLPAAVGDSLRALAFRWSVPIGFGYTLNVAEVFLTMAYMAIIFGWTFVNTTNQTGLVTDPKYYANRAGTIACSQIPVMAALGMRNNIISWVTGISFDRVNYMHRLSARVICILAWIHAGGRLTLKLGSDEVPSEGWIRCGILAITSLTLLCFLSVRPARKRAYEFFLAVHLIFALIFIFGTLFHLAGRSLTYYGAWPAMIVWGLDRLIRVGQVLVYNYGYFLPSFFKKSATSPSSNEKDTTQGETLDAQVTLLTPHFIRISMRRPTMRWRAGQSAFLSFPGISAASRVWPLEAHPFTISTLDTAPEKELVFILRIHKGFTQRLARAAVAPGSPPNEGLQRVFVNGPCSAPPVLVGYQRIVLVAGGSGVSFITPLLLDVVRRARAGDTSCQNVTFIWAIRDIEHITFIQEILAPLSASPLPSSLSVKIFFYLTPATTSASSSEASSIADGEGANDIEKWAESSEPPTPALTSTAPSVDFDGPKDPKNSFSIEDEKRYTPRSGTLTPNQESLLALPFVRIRSGRPDVPTLLHEEIAAATGRVSVNVCGTHSLAESARVALRAPRVMDILRGGPTVTLHVEGFGA